MPSAAVIADDVGLHPNITVEYDPVNVGGVTSEVHETVLEVVAVLPHPSVAVNVLTCDWPQLLVCTAPSRDVIVRVPHPSVALAVPRAAIIAGDVGLHPNTIVGYDPVNVGGVTSTIHVTVREVVTVLPHPSLAVNVLTCDRPQLLVCTGPVVNVIVGVPHASVAVADPRAAVIERDDGLHPKFSVR